MLHISHRKQLISIVILASSMGLVDVSYAGSVGDAQRARAQAINEYYRALKRKPGITKKEQKALRQKIVGTKQHAFSLAVKEEHDRSFLKYGIRTMYGKEYERLKPAITAAVKIWEKGKFDPDKDFGPESLEELKQQIASGKSSPGKGKRRGSKSRYKQSTLSSGSVRTGPSRGGRLKRRKPAKSIVLDGRDVPEEIRY